MLLEVVALRPTDELVDAALHPAKVVIVLLALKSKIHRQNPGGHLKVSN